MVSIPYVVWNRIVVAVAADNIFAIAIAIAIAEQVGRLAARNLPLLATGRNPSLVRQSVGPGTILIASLSLL
jgi:hypothetical protein